MSKNNSAVKDSPEQESQIRELAYSKWESAGCPDTDDNQRNQFWLEAEQEILKKSRK